MMRGGAIVSALALVVGCKHSSTEDTEDTEPATNDTQVEETGDSAIETTPGLADAPYSPDEVMAVQSTVADALPDDETWWPWLPGAYVVGYNLPPEQLSAAGEIFRTNPSFEHINDLEAGEGVQTRLLVYDDVESAQAGYEAFANTDAGTTIDGPKVTADQHRYFTKLDGDWYNTTLRFQAGPVVGRVSDMSTEAYLDADTLSAYALPLLTNLQALFAGTFAPDPLPEEFDSLMPTSEVLSEAGNGLMFAHGMVPISHWALYSCCGNADVDARAAMQELEDNGAEDDAMYELIGLGDLPLHHLEIELMTFADGTGALGWFGVDDTELYAAPKDGLELGETGDYATFTGGDGQAFEYLFVKGEHVADIYCMNDWEETTSADCEGVVRQLAESWYATLP